MKRKTSKAVKGSQAGSTALSQSSAKAGGADIKYVMQRLDQSLPLITDDWQRVEQLLNLITEFAPTEIVMELAGAIASYADDQAQRGYVLGQEDIVKELRKRVA